MSGRIQESTLVSEQYRSLASITNYLPELALTILTLE